MVLKGIVHPNMKMLSSFTHPQVVPNLHEFLLLNTNKDILKNICNWTSIVWEKSWTSWNTIRNNNMQLTVLCYVWENTSYIFCSRWSQAINPVELKSNYYDAISYYSCLVIWLCTTNIWLICPCCFAANVRWTIFVLHWWKVTYFVLPVQCVKHGPWERLV